MPPRNRRDFLTAALGGAAGLKVLGTGIAAAGAQPPSIGVTRLSDGLVQITGAGGNVVAMSGPDGVLMVDSGAPGRTRALLAAVAEQWAGRPVEVLFNTHWHPDHTGGNAAIGGAGARILAHENTRLWMDTTFHVDWQDRTYEPREKAAQPTDTFYESGELTFGGRRVVYGHAPQAHTDGDVWVFFPEANVLAAGGIVTAGRYPVLDYITGGWIRGMKEATQTLIDMTDSGTRIVPARGPAQPRGHLTAQHTMLAEMEERMIEAMMEGLSPDEILAKGISSDFDKTWGDPGLFIRNAYWGIWGHAREIRGIV